MGMCFDKRVIGGVAVVALGVLVFYPHAFGVALPLLAVAVCPLSMLFMMRRGNDGAACSMGSSDTANTTAGAQQPVSEDELRELREEINVLRAELNRRRQATEV